MKNKYYNNYRLMVGFVVLSIGFSIQVSHADSLMRTYHFSDGSTEIAGGDDKDFLCITRSDMNENANNTISIVANGKTTMFILYSSNVMSADRNRNFSVEFSYEGKIYEGSMVRAITEKNSFKLNLPEDSALAFLRSFNSDGKISMIFVPLDTKGFPSIVDINWKSFSKDMKHQENCEVSKGHITDAISHN